MDSFGLEGKRALITGGSRGIGFGIARAMVAAGADVALIARGKEGLHDAETTLAASGRRIWTYPFDASRTGEIGTLYDTIVADTGGIDILVNNAGTARRNPAQDVTDEEWSSVITINLTALFKFCQAFGRERIGSGRSGKIVNIASIMSEAARVNNTPYAASKGGVRQLTKALAVDWAKHRINVNALGPGFIKTELNRPLWEDPEFDRWVRDRTPMGRWGSPEDLGNIAVFLASEASDFITGQIIYADGGWLSSF